MDVEWKHLTFIDMFFHIKLSGPFLQKNTDHNKVGPLGPSVYQSNGPMRGSMDGPKDAMGTRLSVKTRPHCSCVCL